MTILSKDQILEADDLKTETVEVPEWSGSVIVRSMTGADRDAFENSLVTVKADGTRVPNMVNMRTKLVALTVVNESGGRMFDETEVDRLALKSAAALKRVYEAAERINGVGQAAQADAEKNSEADPSGASTSA